ncbi:MAG: alpha/beta hydrolase [Deltaproteobacteria bacterium]|nr:alpha/beta hydrolase [Deltaproteobacteria bacterium]MBN2674589.1 alpha/beta hydrolase [Deltaproteobacteria bacterium]
MKRRIHLFVAILLAGSCLLAGCRLVTNSRPGMQIKVNQYFDEDGHTYPNLNDSIFNLKMRVSGVLTPQKFVKEIGFWIFLTGPHDPKKIPVVLVHGHWTGPPAFQTLASSLDTDRFEPWFTYYPTGLNIQEAAEMFRISLARIAHYYQQDTVLLVAFSMGGLVAREAIVNATHAHELPQIPLLIGVANPWGGSIKTGTGARSAFLADPYGKFSYGAESWKMFYDDAPYIKHMYKKQLPEQTAFHLIYGVGGTDADLPGRNDNTLCEKSLARPEAVAEALSVTVLENATHQTIVSDNETIDVINRLLLDYWMSNPPAHARP